MSIHLSKMFYRTLLEAREDHNLPSANQLQEWMTDAFTVADPEQAVRSLIPLCATALEVIRRSDPMYGLKPVPASLVIDVLTALPDHG